jgi:anti-anti-sigma regulatory factor
MIELLSPVAERVTFSAPQQMSGPNVYRLQQEILGFLGEGQKEVVIEFGEVEYIDLHGLVILRDLCEMLTLCGSRPVASGLRPEMQDLLIEAELLDVSAADFGSGFALKMA